MLRGIEELATENISYTVEKTGNVYDFNTAEKLNQLLIKLLLATGQLAEGGEYDVQSFPFESFLFRFIAVPAKWIRTARHYELNIYTYNKSYLNPFALADG